MGMRFKHTVETPFTVFYTYWMMFIGNSIHRSDVHHQHGKREWKTAFHGELTRFLVCTEVTEERTVPV